MQKLAVLLAAGLIALATGACAGIRPAGDMTGMEQSTMVTETPADGMDHGTMQPDASIPFDAQFIDSMIEHHQGAIAMAQQVLEQAEHPELRQMAEEIIAAQAKEIEEMAAWRQEWYPDLPPTGGMGMEMGEMMIGEDASVPFDQRFLEAMISHHQGAIEMARMAQQMAERAEIMALAGAIIDAQEAEIEQMQSWLDEWSDESSTSSPYASQVDSPVRGLSAQEVDDLLAGRGMGYARMAELNNYPGPLHLLELQQELNLSSEQVTAISALFAEMQAQAQHLGQQIVTQEQMLSAAFANGAISEADLEEQVMALADLYGQLRVVHLRTHLLVTPLLTEEQINAYNELRGYSGRAKPAHGHDMHH